MENLKTKSNKNMWNMTFNGLVLQIIFLLVSTGSLLLSISNTDSLNTFIFLNIIFSFLLIISLITSGMVFRRALPVHLIFSLWVLTWISPFFLSGFIFDSKNVLRLIFVFILFFLNVLLAYNSTLKNLCSNNKPAISSGRLSLGEFYWDLSKHLTKEPINSPFISIAKIIIPFGAALGSILYRSVESQQIMTGVMYFMAVLLGLLFGQHLAIARYLYAIEKEYKRYINV